MNKDIWIKEGLYYFPMKVFPFASLKTEDGPLCMCDSQLGLVGFIPVFDNKKDVIGLVKGKEELVGEFVLKNNTYAPRTE